MELEQTYVVEIFTAQEGKVEEVKQMLLHAAELCGQVPGVHRAWVVQDQRDPSEMAFLLIGDAQRFAGILQEIVETEWHKEMALQAPKLHIEERKRTVTGLALP